MTGALRGTDREATGEAFEELEAVVEHLDAADACGPLFGRVKQELESHGRLSEEMREAFVDRIVDLYVQARNGREDAEREDDRAEADAYHRDAAALLNAVSMLCFADPEADREQLMDRIEDACNAQQD